MTEAELTQALKEGNVAIDAPTTETPTAPQTPQNDPQAVFAMKEDTEGDTPILEALKRPFATLTADPTVAPRNFTEQIKFGITAGSVWLQFYANGAWQKIIAWAVSKLVAGDNIVLDPTTGIGDVTIHSRPQSITYSLARAETLTVGDEVSYLAAGTDVPIVFQDAYAEDLSVGVPSGGAKRAVMFIAPISLPSGFNFKIEARKHNSPADSFSLKICSDSGGLPGSVLEQHNVSTTGTYALITQGFTTALTASTKYWLIVERSGASDAIDYFEVKAASWGPYFNSASYNDSISTWTDTTPGSVFCFEVNGSYSAGLRKSLDVPNAIGMQGNYVGVVSVVSGSNATVLKGIYTTTGLTEGSEYSLSTTTPGSLVVGVGDVVIGKAITATQLLIYDRPRIMKTASLNMNFASSTITFSILTGFRAIGITVHAFGNTYASSGVYGISGIKWRSSSNPSACGLWNTDDTGVGTYGSSGDVSSVSGSKVVFAAAALAQSPRVTAQLQFRN